MEKLPEKDYLEKTMGLKEEAILSYCEKLGVTPNILFTGLFGILMAKYSNAEDSLLSTIYNGRNDSRLENTVCMLVKTLPVYCKFDPRPPYRRIWQSFPSRCCPPWQTIFSHFRYSVQNMAEFGSYICIPGRAQ